MKSVSLEAVWNESAVWFDLSDLEARKPHAVNTQSMENDLSELESGSVTVRDGASIASPSLVLNSIPFIGGEVPPRSHLRQMKPCLSLYPVALNCRDFLLFSLLFIWLVTQAVRGVS